VVVIFKLPVASIGTRFGGIPSGFPTLKIPHFRLDLLRPLISPAITAAMLGAIESLMSAVVSDRMSGEKHNPNVELVGHGRRLYPDAFARHPSQRRSKIHEERAL
jgi:SulP family sulfate permease